MEKNGICASKISAVLFIAIGMIAHPDLLAILKLPSWNGRSSSSSLFLFRVPSGKMQMEMPDLIFSIAAALERVGMLEFSEYSYDKLSA